MAGLGVVAGGVLRAPDLDQLRAWSGAEVELVEGQGAAWSEVEVRSPEGALRLRLLERDSRQFAQQVTALARFALASEHPQRNVIALRLSQSNTLIGLSAREGQPAWRPLVQRLAQHLNALVLHEGRLLDHELRALIAAAGEADPAAVLPVLPEALERTRRSEKRLELFDLDAPPLLPLPSSEEVPLRPAREVAERCQALWAVAARAGGLEREPAIELLQGRGLWRLATPAEADYLLEAEHDAEDAAAFAARKEALRALLWALERWDVLGPPNHVTDLDEITRVLRRHDADAFLRGAALRSTAALLDEACVHARCHVMLELFERAGREPPKGLRPDVVRERHRALTWLLATPPAPWDEVFR